jgi:hypothetical protein
MRAMADDYFPMPEDELDHWAEHSRTNGGDPLIITG